MDGLFSLANKLFGINVEPADGLAPVRHFYHYNILFFWVCDCNAWFVTDNYVHSLGLDK